MLIVSGRPELAERMIRTVLGEAPNSAIGNALLAMALADRGRGTEAVPAADQAIRLNPNLPLAHAARFRAMQAIGRPWDAELSARKALELDPAEPNRYANLGEAMLRWGRHDEALAVSRQGLRLDPRHLPCLHVQALALVFLNRAEEADAALSAALLEAPALAVLHAAVGRALEQQGHIDAAAGEYREALRLDASEAMALKGLHRVTSWYARLRPKYLHNRARRLLRDRDAAAGGPRGQDGAGAGGANAGPPVR
jgi:tetratricopeptide (TPR) repeat protein